MVNKPSSYTSGCNAHPGGDTAVDDAPPASAFLRLIWGFSPPWFAISMGTGIISVLLHTAPHRFPGMAAIGTVLFAANILLFIAFSLLISARFLLFPRSAVRRIISSGQVFFTGTIPMALATIVHAVVTIVVPEHGKWAVDLAWVLWWIDVVLTVLVTFGIPVIMFHSKLVPRKALTGALQLAFIPSIVNAAAGGVTATVLPFHHAMMTLLISYVLWAFGVALCLFVMVHYLNKLSNQKFPNKEVILSAYLPLGPCGQGAYAILEIAVAGRQTFETAQLSGDSDAGQIVLVMSTIVSLVLWGLGLWWFVHGSVSVLVRMLSGGLRFNPSFWCLIFPLGVFVQATIKLGLVLPSAFFRILAMVLLVLLVVMYILVLLATIKDLWKEACWVVSCAASTQEIGEATDEILSASIEQVDDLANSWRVLISDMFS